MCGALRILLTLPLLVDADTGFGASAFNIARTVKSLIKAGAGAMHIEDQVQAKRCGHRPGKVIVSESGNGGSHQGSGGCQNRSRFCHHGANGCAGGGRTASRHRTRHAPTWRQART